MKRRITQAERDERIVAKAGHWVDVIGYVESRRGYVVSAQAGLMSIDVNEAKTTAIAAARILNRIARKRRVK